MTTARMGLLAYLSLKLDAIKAHALIREHRAEVLREAADALDESETLRDLTDDHMHDVNAAANELRRMADEAAPLTDFTVYRASHDSIVMGLYTTAAEARKHCVTLVRREYDETSKVHLWWREDEDTVDQPEDGEQELYEHVKSVGVTGPGWTHRTGYVVTPLTVAAKFDEEADE